MMRISSAWRARSRTRQSSSSTCYHLYRDFGFDDFAVKFADRPEVRAGEDEVWDRAEKALMDATKAAGIEMDMNLGEGAFYGPKLEFVLRDAIGREWQCGTLQADFVLPERLDASYVGEDGERHRPVMLHRAILGSFERFLGVLIEHYAGRMPLWLSPVQAVVATITGDADAYANDVINACKMAGLRVEADLQNEKINYKIREHSLTKVPVLMVVGNRETEDRTVALRSDSAERIKILALDDAIHTRRRSGISGGQEFRPERIRELKPHSQGQLRRGGVDRQKTSIRTPVKKGPRVNEEIEVVRVRLIDENGENHGIVPISEALAMAQDAGLDLLELSPNADPPVL